MLPMRRSGIFLRHSFIVAPLLSLNGTLGMAVYCRLSLIWDLLFLIVPIPLGHEQLLERYPFPGGQRLI
jgi:hypothetical protein